MQESFKNLHIINWLEEYTRSFDIRYVAEIRHLGLESSRILKNLEKSILENKVEDQFKKWDTQWARKVHQTKSRLDKEANLSVAQERTAEAKKLIEQIENILLHTLKVNDAVDWNNLRDKKTFSIANPKLKLEAELSNLNKPVKPSLKKLPTKPERDNFKMKLTFLDRLIPTLKERKIKHADKLYNEAFISWEKSVKEIEIFNNKLKIEYEKNIKDFDKIQISIRKKYDDLEAVWKREEENYYRQLHERNAKVDELKNKYEKCDPTAIIEYCELVLNSSVYPDNFPKDFEIEYNFENKFLMVEYILPSPSDLPTLEEVKYIAAKKELKEQHLSDSLIAKIYDSTIYKITLRSLHELFEADQANAIESIVFNGWVSDINKATGKRVNSCIISIKVNKTEFNEIELSNVDPKTCFKNLKGIGSSKLSGIVPIQPILQINKNDKRFVVSYDVAHKINEGYNLASMDWEDFEHLLREIFAKEFSLNGGEVKVTQASRDGGVDAIAFDPDPIRGGKIVIQAKRYTNTVGVSAVRDLYGTVMNEGATKGILVTTADYGPDAYEFIKNKPLTIMNGSELLYLLEKHGHKARIDLAEAKRLQQG